MSEPTTVTMPTELADRIDASLVQSNELMGEAAAEIVHLRRAVSVLFDWLTELDPDACEHPSGYIGTTSDMSDPVCAAADRAVALTAAPSPQESKP